MKSKNLNIDLSNYNAVNQFWTSEQNLGDIQAENSLVASIINNRAVFDTINPHLKSDMFFNSINRLIFESSLELREEQKEINEISLMSKTKINKDFLVSLRLEQILVASPINLSLRIIDAFNTERIKTIIQKPSFDMTIEREEIDEIIEFSKKALESSETTTVHKLADLMKIETTQVFLSTGLEPIDIKIGGIAQCGLITIAGRPKMGKTSFMTTMCLKSSCTSKVAYLTIEMTAEQIVNKIKYMNIAQCNIDNIQIVDYPFPHLSKIMVTINQLATQGVKIFYLDYLQLIKTKFSGTNEVASLSMITLELKLLAKRLGITIVTGSQLSRGIESREDKRPLMSDLKGSGSIEQDSDTIMALHRDDPDASLKPNGTKVSLYILANRHGKSGVINDLYMFPTGEFREQTEAEVRSELKK